MASKFSCAAWPEGRGRCGRTSLAAKSETSIEGIRLSDIIGLQRRHSAHHRRSWPPALRPDFPPMPPKEKKEKEENA